jgi:hypothetical protein
MRLQRCLFSQQYFAGQLLHAACLEQVLEKPLYMASSDLSITQNSNG